VLYGDNAPSGVPFEDLKALEIFLSQAGLTLQNALLRRRLESLSQRSAAPGGEAAA
jgi:GAF domain-containing protein